MARFITIENPTDQWWRGSLTLRFNYNLKKVLFFVLCAAIVAAVVFILYWLGVGLVVAFKWLCVNYHWAWILGAIVLAMIIWPLTKIKWPKWQPREHRELKAPKWLWYALAALLLVIIGILCFRGCSSDDQSAKQQISASAPATTITPTRFNETFDWVVTTRAYLDGVHGNGNRLALVGLKYVNGNPVSNQVFDSNTYQESKRVIAEEWRELIVSTCGNVHLSEQQLVAVTLFAMRNGKYGFLSSDFVKELQAGRTFGAEKTMAIHFQDGTKRQLGPEGHQYIWALQQLYNGNLDMHQLLDMPMFSYKRLPLSKMYDQSGAPLFQSEYLSTLKHGDYDTPRKALDL